MVQLDRLNHAIDTTLPQIHKPYLTNPTVLQLNMSYEPALTPVIEKKPMIKTKCCLVRHVQLREQRMNKTTPNV